jgi:Ger(x)C family germination protein
MLKTVCTGLLPLLILLTGCAKLQIIDEIKIVQSLGYDIEDGKIVGYASYPLFKNTHRGSPLELMKGQSNTIHGVTTSFTTQSQYPIALGQTRTVVVSERFAKEGISDLLHSLARDPMIGSGTIVVVTNQSAKNLLKHSLKQPPYYLSNLIRQNMSDGNSPTTDLHLSLNQLFGEGQDVYLPIVNLERGKLLYMDGVGVFQGDKLKAQLSAKEGSFLKLLTDKKLSGKYEFTLQNKERVLLLFLNGRREISVTKDAAIVSFTLHTVLKEYPTTIRPNHEKEMNDLKRNIEEEIATRISSLIEKLQEEDVDPIGFGEWRRAKQRDWNEDRFYKDIYPNLQVDVNAEVIFTQSGVGT